MLKKVLILTPSPGFGGLIRQLLEDTGGFKPMLASDPVQAMHLAQKEALALTILDADLGLKDFPAYISELRSHASQTRLIVIPAEENPTNPQLAELEANAILPSPFYLPDLVSAIEQLFGPLVPEESANRRVYGKPTASLKFASPETNDDKSPAPEWLQNVSLAAGYLTRLSLESSSQAALITRGGKVWAYAGELPKQAADELADAVAEHTSGTNGTDLARFIHLSATDADYMLYATSLGGEYRLALVFDTQTPFSHMRSHVADLAKALTAAAEEVRSEAFNEVEARQSSMARLQGSEAGEVSPAPRSDRPSSGSSEPTPSSIKPGSSVSTSPNAALDAPHDLRYSFVLIPRLPKHHLAGDLAARLQEWLPELCLAFNWRLEGLAVQPEFVQWSVVVSSSQTPEKIARTLDTHLSQRIFEEFPRLGKENPSSQFWAQGFLVTSGAQASSQQISEFISQTRRRQGVISPQI